MRNLLSCIICLTCIACRMDKQYPLTLDAEVTLSNHPIATAALELTKGPYVVYDPAYKSIPYPNGDVAADRGVCADVVIRAYRTCRLPGDTTGIDLQQLVHEDMRKNFRLYPSCWGLSKPDPNIDHRRVPNLMVFFERNGISLPIKEEPEAYLPGDIVSWQLQDGRTHIGIVVDGFGSNGWPLVVHNIGRGQQKANVLFSWKVTGHYRYPLTY
jgi:uncharacterized protein